MDKRCRPPQGYYKVLETAVVSRDRKKFNSKPDVLGINQGERIVAKKKFQRKANVHGKVANLLRQRKFMGAGLVFERGMKVPLQHEESIEIRHDRLLVTKILWRIL